MNIFDISVQPASLEMNICEISSTLEAAILEDNQILPFVQQVTKILPELEGMIRSNLTKDEIRNIIQEILNIRYNSEYCLIQSMVEQKSKLIADRVQPAVKLMLELFQLSYQDRQLINCYLGYFNPFPRDVIKKEYCIHHLVSDEVFIRASLHEINHMILFDKWKSMYGYRSNVEPSYPDTLWYLEELSIEPTLNIPQIQNIAPYKHSAYDSFYQIIIYGKPLPNHINCIYNESTSIEEYLTNAYRFIEQHVV